MKKLLLILLLFLGISSRADINFCTVTITNAPTVNGLTITVNSNVRTWTNNVTANPAIYILTNLTIGGSTTNLFNHFVSSPISGVNIRPLSTTNSVTLYGVGLAVSVSTSPGWAEVSCATVPTTSLTNISVPAAGWTHQQSATNAFSSVATGLNTHSTVALDQTLTIASQLVGLGNAQTITGAKTMTGANVFASASQLFSGGTVSNVVVTNVASFNGNIIGTVTNTQGIITGGTYTNSSITNAAAIGGIVTRLTGGGWENPSLTNGVNYGNALSSRGTQDGAEQFGDGATATAEGATAVGKISKAAGAFSVSLGFETGAYTDNSFAGGASALATNGGLIAIGNSSKATATGAGAFGLLATASNNNSIAFGNASATTDANQIRMGTASISVSIQQNASIGNNLAIGIDWEKNFIAGMTKGVFITNGAAATANPTNGAAMWVEAGELQYRTSASNEGAGTTNRFHNRGSQVTGSGSDFSIAGTAYARVDFGGQDPEIVLPTAGTYIVHATVEVSVGVVANDTFNFKLFNSTDTADVSNSDQRITNISASQTDTLSWPTILTVTATKTIQLYAQNSTAARGTITAVRTKIMYVRLY